jgi:hypothetical protein
MSTAITKKTMGFVLRFLVSEPFDFQLVISHWVKATPIKVVDIAIMFHRKNDAER